MMYEPIVDLLDEVVGAGGRRNPHEAIPEVTDR